MEMKNSFYPTDKICNFFSPNKIILGVAATKQVGREAKFLGGEKALIVTDPGVVKAGLLKGIQESLVSEEISVGIFDRVELEPPARVIDECGKLAREGGYSIIIGVGGGSSLDTAKGASIVATNTGKVLDYTGVDTVPKRGASQNSSPHYRQWKRGDSSLCTNG